MIRCSRRSPLLVVLLLGLFPLAACDNDRKLGGSSDFFCNSDECKIGASDGGASQFFGSTISMDGDLLAVGAPEDSDNGVSSGAVYIFERDGDDWDQIQKVVADDGAPGDRFGGVVALRGDLLIAAALGNDDNGAASGTAYVFRETAGVWAQEQRLAPLDPVVNHRFGRGVGIAGTVAVVGASGDSEAAVEAGAAYVFREAAGVWTQEQKLLASDGVEGDHFGASVATDGSVISVGAPLADIDPPDPGTALRPNVGNQIQSGAGYVYRFGATWVEEDKVIAQRELLQCEIDFGVTEIFDPFRDDRFGTSTSIDGELVIFGAPFSEKRVKFENNCRIRSDLTDVGSAYIYRHDGGGDWVWERRMQDQDPTAQIRLGTSVAIVDGVDEIAAAGGPGARENGPNSGAGYSVVFDTVAGEWPLTPTMHNASDGNLVDRMGESAAAQDGFVAFGATGDDPLGANSGSVYIFPVD